MVAAQFLAGGKRRAMNSGVDTAAVQANSKVSFEDAWGFILKGGRSGDLLKELETGTLSLADAAARIDAIDQEPPPWGWFASMLGYALTALGLAPLLGGGWFDTLYATLFSMLVYGLVLLSGRMGGAATTWLPLSSAFVVGVLAAVVKLWVPELNLVLVILSAVAIILPGYTISPGAGELVAMTMVAGILIAYTIVRPESGL